MLQHRIRGNGLTQLTISTSIPKKFPNIRSDKNPTTSVELVSSDICEALSPTISRTPEQHGEVCVLLLSQTRSRSLASGLQLHAHVIKSGIQSFPNVSHHLINFYSKLQLPINSARIFEETEHRTSTTWSSAISSYAQNEMPLLAIEYFRRMMISGTKPDDRIIPSALKACAIMGRQDVGASFHSLATKIGLIFDVYIGSAVIGMYAKCRSIHHARKMFDEMPTKNEVTWSGMIYGYSQLTAYEEALFLFKDALLQEIEINDFTLSSVLRVCAESTLFELGSQLHGLALKTSYDTSSFVSSSLVSVYSKCGFLDSARQVFGESPDTNLGLWNAMMIAYAQHGHTDKVFTLFETMKADNKQPNFITFLNIIYACSHAGLVTEGKYYFNLMMEHGIEPGAHHYASYVDLLCRAGELDEAVRVISSMSVEPTVSMWGAVLTGCRTHKNHEMAAWAADRAMERGLVGSGLHVLVSNAYASAGRYGDAASVRKMLRDMGVRKETGLSWVEEGGRVHTFAAGDREHPLSREIYRKLWELEEGMSREGYVSDTSQDEKKNTARFHSERLAVAFALVRLASDRVIRVMKNLRVCEDCHTAIKIMSKITNRVILLRDYNRFHRFQSGKCSCNDYW